MAIVSCLDLAREWMKQGRQDNVLQLSVAKLEALLENWMLARDGEPKLDEAARRLGIDSAPIYERAVKKGRGNLKSKGSGGVNETCARLRRHLEDERKLLGISEDTRFVTKPRSPCKPIVTLTLTITLTLTLRPYT